MLQETRRTSACASSRRSALLMVWRRALQVLLSAWMADRPSCGRRRSSSRSASWACLAGTEANSGLRR